MRPELPSRLFDAWWRHEVSGMPPLPGEDAEAHVRRICRLAWLEAADWAHGEARTALAQPVPVSERLPCAEDCDAERFCWFFSPADPTAGTFGVAACWVLRKFEPEDDFRTHWLPAHALPLPS